MEVINMEIKFDEIIGDESGEEKNEGDEKENNETEDEEGSED